MAYTIPDKSKGDIIDEADWNAIEQLEKEIKDGGNDSWDSSLTLTALDDKIKNTSTGHSHDGVNSRKIDHNDLLNKGTNTHSDIDNHIANTNNPHNVTASQVGCPISIDGVSNPGGNIDLEPQEGISITPDDTNNKIQVDISGIVKYGANFPTNPSNYMQFYYTGTVYPEGIYIYNGSDWIQI